MKILAFGASSSRNSINQKLAKYTAQQFADADINLFSLHTLDLPIYGIEQEGKNGIPSEIGVFVTQLEQADLIIISFAEHNGSYTTAFKNLFDWTSRFKLKFLEGKKVLVLSTAPGPRGGASVLNQAMNRLPIHGAEIVGSFTLPNFNESFAETDGILDTTKKEELIGIIKNIV
ncbi:MAG: NADPH-dependent FMN reductase [Leadbetterella sp.]